MLDTSWANANVRTTRHLEFHLASSGITRQRMPPPPTLPLFATTSHPSSLPPPSCDTDSIQVARCAERDNAERDNAECDDAECDDSERDDADRDDDAYEAPA